jgi:diguanylate cyclase (GGDEF)-like protein
VQVAVSPTPVELEAAADAALPTPPPSPPDLDFEPPPSPADDEIPAEWLKMLEAESIESKSFVEASVEVLRLEVWSYREQLVSIENRIRACSRNPDAGTIQQLLQELRDVNRDWLAKQAQAAVHLGERRGGLGHFEEVGGNLENVLLDQQAQIETTCNNVDLLDFRADLGSACHRLLVEIFRLLELSHLLRDRMQESLITILRADRRLDAIERRLQVDSLTGLLNRSGMEIVLHEWWRDDIARQRLVSVVLIDLDGCARLNERIGTRKCDRLLMTFGKLLDEMVPKDRGYNHLARFTGQTFALFCGDTGPRNAMSLAERIRQTIAAASFSVGDDELEVTASCAVTEVQKDDTPERLHKRLLKTLQSAKNAGRNCTALDEGQGPTLVEAPQFQVKSRQVRVDEAV